MDTLQKGKNKLGEICDLLKKETLEPAKQEAQHILDNANQESQKIIEQAHQQSHQLLEEAKAKIEQEKKLFESSMELAAKQTFEQLKEKVFENLFNHSLTELSGAISQNAELLAQLVSGVVNALEKEGLHSNLTLQLAQHLNAEDIAKHLAASVKQKIQEQAVTIDSIAHGAKVVVQDKNISIDISDQSLKELMASFLRDAFKAILFKNN